MPLPSFVQRSPLRPASPGDLPAPAGGAEPASPCPCESLPHRGDSGLAAGLRQGSCEVSLFLYSFHTKLLMRSLEGNQMSSDG